MGTFRQLGHGFWARNASLRQGRTSGRSLFNTYDELGTPDLHISFSERLPFYSPFIVSTKVEQEREFRKKLGWRCRVVGSKERSAVALSYGPTIRTAKVIVGTGGQYTPARSSRHPIVWRYYFARVLYSCRFRRYTRTIVANEVRSCPIRTYWAQFVLPSFG